METFTTHQVAKLLGVSLPTVVNWINAGRLEAYRTPGGHRRIPAKSILVFCRTFNIPEPLELRLKSAGAAEKPTIVIASFENDFAELLKEFLVVKTGFKVVVAESAFTLGLALGKADGGIVVIDWPHFSIDLLDLQSKLPSVFQPLFVCNREEETTVVQEHFPDAPLLRQPLSLDEIHASIGRSLERILSV